LKLTNSIKDTRTVLQHQAFDMFRANFAEAELRA